MIPGLLAIILAFSIMGTAVVEVTLTNFSVTGNIVKSKQAFNIAEAGLNYYLWHLNHNYIDTNGVNDGTYTLWIKPASAGSTIVTVRSIGQTAGTNISRTVQAQIG